jgi:hypothetical protein
MLYTLPARQHNDRMMLVNSKVTVQTPAISTAVRATSSKLLMEAAEAHAASRTAAGPSPDTSGTRNVPTGLLIAVTVILRCKLGGYSSSKSLVCSLVEGFQHDKLLPETLLYHLNCECVCSAPTVS